jgi:aspartyl-tRNA synthetase
MNKINIKDLNDYIDKEVTLYGWVDNRRDHGKLIFLDLRDETGKIQVVVLPKPEEIHGLADRLRSEWVVLVKGLVKQRPEKMVNSDDLMGNLEIELLNLEIISKSKTSPFDLSTDGFEVKEELRMKYRYLDLRRARLQKNIRNRSCVNLFLRNFLTQKNFIEIETPLLTRSTPEGARDYVVPSRVYGGSFYALPQSPQQYKQLLMISGFEKYFQFARCMRDEDTRGDRQPEFTQLDIESSFIEREDIMSLIEDMYTEMVQKIYPDKHMTKTPWPRISHSEALKRYGSDRPDIRKNTEDKNELGFAWVIDFPLFEKEKSDQGYFLPEHHMFTAPKDSDLKRLKSNPEKAVSQQIDLSLNGFEIAGGSIRIHNAETQNLVFDLIGFSEKDKKEFSHMLEAFSYGVPPHGGIATGLDRLMAILENESSIREVIAFPKTGEGRDPMMNTPAKISEKQLNELHLKLDNSKNNHLQK